MRMSGLAAADCRDRRSSFINAESKAKYNVQHTVHYSFTLPAIRTSKAVVQTQVMHRMQTRDIASFFLSFCNLTKVHPEDPRANSKINFILVNSQKQIVEPLYIH